MKRLMYCLALGALFMAACKQDAKDFKTHSDSGSRCYLQVFDKPFIEGVDTIGMKITYSLEFPDEGMVSPAARRALQYLYFGDSNITSMTDAIEKRMKKDGVDDWFFYAGEDAKILPVESIDENRPYSNLDIKGSCQQDSLLVTFTVMSEEFPFGAAHGLYSVDYLILDRLTGNAVQLSDLVVDTNLLCEAIAHAIQDLEVNKDTRECLFDEFKEADRMPMPRNFVIDSSRDMIIVVYGLYEITPYCCGIQSIVLPIFWLSKHVPLTPYAKKLFGEGSYIE